MQATITAPHSRALIQFLNFSDPHSDILGAQPGTPRGFAEFHRSMELDILAGVHKEIQVTVNGQLQPHYIKKPFIIICLGILIVKILKFTLMRREIMTRELKSVMLTCLHIIPFVMCLPQRV